MALMLQILPNVINRRMTTYIHESKVLHTRLDLPSINSNIIWRYSLKFVRYNRPQQNSLLMILYFEAITPLQMTLLEKVWGVLKNLGNSLSDEHRDFPIWSKGS